MSDRIASFLLKDGLYSSGLPISVDDTSELTQFFEGIYRFDAFCVKCTSMSTFISNKHVFRGPGGPGEYRLSKEERYANFLISHKNFRSEFACARNSDHTLVFCCLIKDEHIIKYGQYPSMAELEKGNLAKYKKILGKDFLDFSRGIGLYSHGVGAGSLVYLRRIFENLIEDAHNEAKKSKEWDDGLYPARMDEKIKALKDYLPDYLVENRKIYGILSKGIHELPEDVCVEVFPVVKTGIEIILDEKLEQQERDRKKKETSQQLEKLLKMIE